MKEFNFGFCLNALTANKLICEKPLTPMEMRTLLMLLVSFTVS